MQSFAVYGFPESHAISFALIAYASCWLKVHRTPEFYCALLNNQPMGFYSNATLVRDAKAHGVAVRPISVLHSEWLCTIEDDGAIRLGLSMVKGMDSAIGKRIASERPFASLQDFRNRVTSDKLALRMLARIGALNGLVEHRRDGLWKIETPHRPEDLPGLAADTGAALPLASMNAFERLDADFSGTGVTTGGHPMALIRERLHDVTLASDLPQRSKWKECSHRWNGHMPSASRDCQRICLYQSRRRNRRVQRYRRTSTLRTAAPHYNPGTLPLHPWQSAKYPEHDHGSGSSHRSSALRHPRHTGFSRFSLIAQSLSLSGFDLRALHELRANCHYASLLPSHDISSHRVGQYNGLAAHCLLSNLEPRGSHIRGKLRPAKCQSPISTAMNSSLLEK